MANTEVLGAYFEVPLIGQRQTMSPEWQRVFIDLFSDAVTFSTANGYVVRTAAGNVEARAITPASNKVVITNSNGVSGNTTIDLDQTKIDHNQLDNYVANEHINWTSTTSNLNTSGTAATGNLTVTGTGSFTGNLSTEGELTIDAASGTETAKVGGVIHVDTTAVGNVGSGEDDLITYTLPANTLDTNGQIIKITAAGTTASNGNNKTIKLYLGSTELTSASANTPNDQDWCFEAIIIRKGSSSQVSLVKFFSNDSSDDTVDVLQDSEDLTTNLVIKCTGEATSDDDIVQELMVIEWKNV